jgi:hypothetical protein
MKIILKPNSQTQFSISDENVEKKVKKLISFFSRNQNASIRQKLK